MEGNVILYLIHISRDRMIDYGADSLSRECSTEGSMRGELIVSFLPFHLTVEEQSEGVVPWIRSC